ncbi:MAG: M43 family zinc metalloprotease, partial [Bacteroidota bacterium]
VNGDVFGNPNFIDYTYSIERSPDSVLNIYILDVLEETRLLGQASFPWDDVTGVKGVMITQTSLPQIGVGMQGKTLTHEVGHYFGLFHTFGNLQKYPDGCFPGDFILDTEPEQAIYYTCDDTIPSCPGNSAHKVYNYMSYGYDSCMTAFSRHQFWTMYRHADIYNSFEISRISPVNP